MRASEDPQDKAMVAVVESLTAVARLEPRAALRHARLTLTHAEALGISHDCVRWAWPLAARAADELRDRGTPSLSATAGPGRRCAGRGSCPGGKHRSPFG